LDADFRMAIKKLYKKDALTKQKSLEELKSLIETKSQEDCVLIVPYWAKLFTKLSIVKFHRYFSEENSKLILENSYKGL
jgi:hypothetical protein